MNEPDPIIQFLSRAENLSIALDIDRALKAWDTRSSDAIGGPISEVLSNQDNLVIARSIVQRIKPINDNLIRRFWPTLYDGMKDRLKSSKLTSNWQIKLSGEKKWTRPYATCTLYPQMDEKGKDAPYLHLEIQQADSYNLNFGVARGEDRRKRPSYWKLKEVTRIRTYLKKKRFREGTWWLGYTSNYNVREGAFLLAMAGRSDDFIGEIADNFWDLFEAIRALIEQANQAITHMYLQRPDNRSS